METNPDVVVFVDAGGHCHGCPVWVDLPNHTFIVSDHLVAADGAVVVVVSRRFNLSVAILVDAVVEEDGDLSTPPSPAADDAITIEVSSGTAWVITNLVSGDLAARLRIA